MNARILASVSFTIIGVYAVSRGLLMLGSLMMVPGMAEHYRGSVALLALGYAVPAALLIAFGSFLVTKSAVLAQRLVPDADLSEKGESAKIPELAFTILGLYFCIASLPWLGSLATDFIDYLIVGTTDDMRRAVRLNPGRFFGYLMQFSAGVVLFFGADTLAGWWRRRVASG